jgi:hypothetical protein
MGIMISCLERHTALSQLSIELDCQVQKTHDVRVIGQNRYCPCMRLYMGSLRDPSHS